MIPVLVCPSISNFLLLERMLRSIDHPVSRVLVVDNSCSGYTVPADIADVLSIDYIRPALGLGYGGGINEGIRATPGAKWWMFTNNDIVFEPGGLASVAERMDRAQAPLLLHHDFTYGAVNRALVDRVGLFDDWSFYPIYFDDNDYHTRCVLAGAEIILDGSVIRYMDGASHTIRSDDWYRSANNASFTINRQKYVEKWGGMPGEESYATPWNTGYPLWYTVPCLGDRSSRIW